MIYWCSEPGIMCVPKNVQKSKAKYTFILSKFLRIYISISYGYLIF